MSATRRTVDITVDAYDAPGLIAVARERERQRELGHADGAIPPMKHPTILISHARYFQRVNAERESCESVLLEEVSEAVEELFTASTASDDSAAAHAMRHASEELVQVAATALRFATAIDKMAHDLYAKGARKCQCQWEAGDSPCPVHGEESE